MSNNIDTQMLKSVDTVENYNRTKFIKMHYHDFSCGSMPLNTKTQVRKDIKFFFIVDEQVFLMSNTLKHKYTKYHLDNATIQFLFYY